MQHIFKLTLCHSSWLNSRQWSRLWMPSDFQNPSWPGRKFETKVIRVTIFQEGWRCLPVSLLVILHQQEDSDPVCLQDFRPEEMNLLTPTDTAQDIFHSRSESVWTNNGKGKGHNQNELTQFTIFPTFNRDIGNRWIITSLWKWCKTAESNRSLFMENIESLR